MRNVEFAKWLMDVDGREPVIMMTNDSAYWNKSKNGGTLNSPIDDEFRIHEGNIVLGIRNWKENANDASKKNRERPIHLTNEYKKIGKSTN